jgi:hypothetical protein
VVSSTLINAGSKKDGKDKNQHNPCSDIVSRKLEINRLQLFLDGSIACECLLAMIQNVREEKSKKKRARCEKTYV